MLSALHSESEMIRSKDEIGLERYYSDKDVPIAYVVSKTNRRDGVADPIDQVPPLDGLSSLWSGDITRPVAQRSTLLS